MNIFTLEIFAQQVAAESLLLKIPLKMGKKAGDFSAPKIDESLTIVRLRHEVVFVAVTQP